MAEHPSMMEQYLEIKANYPNCLLFFRLGDFYEMFYEDAQITSRELELVLTGKNYEKGKRAPMCGIPYHSCEGYIARLIEKGYKVAVCEQLEDPAKTKGLVKRGVVRIITPGTVIEGSMLDEAKNNYLATVYLNEDATEAGVCFIDSSTGSVELTTLLNKDVLQRTISELGRFTPREILLCRRAGEEEALCDFIRTRLNLPVDAAEDPRFDYASCLQLVLRHFKKRSATELDLAESPSAVRALGCALSYLYDTQMMGLERLNTLNIYSDTRYMKLDLTARRNLELTETMRAKEKRGSLLGVLDKTKTAMGKRLLLNWLERPLVDVGQITRRLNAVQELFDNTPLRDDAAELLQDIYDLERIMTRIVYGSVNAKEMRALAQTIAHIAPLKARLVNVHSALLCEIQQQLDPLEDVYRWIDDAIVSEPPPTIKEGGIIREGFHAELDELRRDEKGGRGIITRIEAQEKERTGIKTLKVGYNRVFGYYIEVSNSYIDAVPDHYIRKQTLTNAERYVTEELKSLEARVLGARERAIALEYELFAALRAQITEQLYRIQTTASAVAKLDVLCSFAEVAVRQRYVCPQVNTSGCVDIRAGRHPVVEALIKVPFVPNDLLLDDEEYRTVILTGPNMAGKSTYMRQTALIVLMAQIGSFVPADAATIGIVDGIYTRVGASDDLASGQSTFMVEMSEVASILQNATPNSLIIFDEIGRGTSTFDGMSIARAVLEYVVNRCGSKTLFATHYHELTVMEDEMEGVHNFSIAVKKRGDDITFLRRIVRGPADDSYGIEVAKLAGVPEDVVVRAKEILRDIESGEMLPQTRAVEDKAAAQEDDQLSLMPMLRNEVVERLQALDADTLTPIEALQLLYELIQRAKSCG